MAEADQLLPDACRSRAALHITTACAGPPADGQTPETSSDQQMSDLLKRYEDKHDSSYDTSDDEAKDKKGQRVPRLAGCRYLIFNADGTLAALHEVSSEFSRVGKVFR